MDWSNRQALEKLNQKRMEKNPEFKKKAESLYESQNKELFEQIKEQVYNTVLRNIEYQQKNQNFENVVKALKRLLENIQNTHYSDESNEAQEVKDPQNDVILKTPAQVQQTMNRLWDLYKTYCDKVQRLQPEF